MTVVTSELTRLEMLPTETLHAVVDRLTRWEIKKLSCTSKRLRQACLSRLFRRVEFKFSRAGIGKLKCFLKSNICSHVASFTYEVTELLKPDVLDFDYFSSDVLTPENYVAVAKDLYDWNSDAYEIPPYMALYETVHDICEEQRSIIDEEGDMLLSTAFCALPRLTEVRLSFCKALEDNDDCALRPDVIIKDQFHQHHLQVVTNAIQNARSRGIAIHTISLSGFELPYFDTWKEPELDLSALSKSLRQLLEGIKILRLLGSECVWELLSDCALDLHQLDMCGLEAADTVPTGFLESNNKTIQFIGFHRAEISTRRSPWQSSSDLMTASILCKMLGLPQSTPYLANDCGCRLPWWVKGSRLVLGQDRGWERS